MMTQQQDRKCAHIHPARHLMDLFSSAGGICSSDTFENNDLTRNETIAHNLSLKKNKKNISLT